MFLLYNPKLMMEDSRNPLLPPRFCKEVFYRWKSSRTKEIITVRTDKTNKVWKQIPSEIVWENPRLWQIINQTRKVMKLFFISFFFNLKQKQCFEDKNEIVLMTLVKVILSYIPYNTFTQNLFCAKNYSSHFQFIDDSDNYPYPFGVYIPI